MLYLMSQPQSIIFHGYNTFQNHIVAIKVKPVVCMGDGGWGGVLF